MVAVAVDNVEIGKIVGDVNMAIIADSIMITVLEVVVDVITAIMVVEGDVITAIMVVEGDVTTAIMVVEEEIATMETITKILKK